MTKSLMALAASLSAQAQPSAPAVDSLLRAYAALGRFNGSALVVRDGKKRYEKSYGHPGATGGFTRRSIFPIGSLTKSFTALLVLKLAEEGRLSVDDALGKYLPDYPGGDKIKLKHLLTNTAGVHEKFANPAFAAQLTSTRAFSAEERMAFFAHEPLDFEPGTRFRYSNSGFDLLGSVIEKVTGSSYADAVRAYIFKPLHMRNSGLGFAELRDPHKTTLYAYASATKRVETTPWNASLTFSSGGLYSTTADLLKFYRGLSRFQIVTKETFTQATKPFLGGYGYGWYIDALHGDRVIDHGGNVEGATSYLLLMPERRLGIILLNNITSTSLERIGNSIYAITQQQPYSLPQPKKRLALAEQALVQYVGTYAVSATYTIEISQEANKLFVRLNGGVSIPLSAEKEHVFFADDDDLVLEFVVKDNKIIEVKMNRGLTTKVADKVG
jgi:CubicO group peptidase (beta-lactamase class C family)